MSRQSCSLKPSTGMNDQYLMYTRFHIPITSNMETFHMQAAVKMMMQWGRLVVPISARVPQFGCFELPWGGKRKSWDTMKLLTRIHISRKWCYILWAWFLSFVAISHWILNASRSQFKIKINCGSQAFEFLEVLIWQRFSQFSWWNCKLFEKVTEPLEVIDSVIKQFLPKEINSNQNKALAVIPKEIKSNMCKIAEKIKVWPYVQSCCALLIIQILIYWVLMETTKNFGDKHSKWFTILPWQALTGLYFLHIVYILTRNIFWRWSKE